MTAVRKILEEIKWGISPEVLAKKHPWEELTGQDPEELLNFARYQRDSQQAYNLLVYLFRISRDRDLWFSVEVLSQALQHPAMSSEDRNTILRTMRSRLDRIKDEVTARQPAEEKIRKYWLLEASYYAIYGTTLAESGRSEEAVQNYQIAEGIFQQLGLTQQAENYNHKIQRLESGEAKIAPTTGELTERPAPQTPPLSASFRGTMELIASGQLPPTQTPAPVPEERKPDPPLEDPLRLPPAFSFRRADAAGNPIPTQPQPKVEPSPVVDEPSIDDPVDRVVEQPAQPPQTEVAPEVKPTTMPAQEAKPDPQLEAAYLEIVEKTAGKTKELEQIVRQIEEQKEVLQEVQLDIQMYQERRSLLFREVQNLEKKAAYLKELCDRLERKAKQLEKGA